MAGIKNLSRAVAMVVCALLAAPPAVESAAAQDADLRIVVIEGEDSVNIIAQGTAVPTLVEVRDRNDLPVSGASVLFLLGEGGTATLNAGLQQVALTTNVLGQAAVTVNPIASGAVQLSVNATFQGQTAAAAIVQTNFATVAEAAAAGVGATGGAGGGAAAAGGGAGGGLGTGAVVGIAGAAAGAAVGVGVATTGGDPAPPAPPPTPAAAVPSAPLGPTLTPGDGQLGVRWTAPASNGSAIDDYDVRYRPVGGAWTELPDGAKSTATSATIAGLTNGTSYEVQVRAGNSVGDGAWSSSATGTPVSAASVPSAPSAPTLTPGDGQLGVSWRAPSDNGSAIDDYDVRYRPVGGAWTELPDGAKSTATSATIAGLTNGTSYEVQVRAGNSVGDGAWSSSATGTPVSAASVPSAPSAPTLTPGDGQLGVIWRAPSDNGSAIDDYDVRYRPVGGAWTELPDGAKSTATSATIAGLTNGTSYEVQVRAGNSVGDGAWSSSATGTPVSVASVPSAPSAPTLTPGDGQLGVSWRAPSDNGSAIDDYDVRYRPVGGAWTELPDSAKSTATSATIPGLTNGPAYEVQVRAGNSVGDGAWSSSATGTPVEVASGDRAALVEFYDATGGPNWANNTNWNSSAPLDQWYGVSTDDNGRVTVLDLAGNQLSGSIPSSLGRLTNLTVLQFNSNQLTGPVSSVLGQLMNLRELYLYANQLTGPIPSFLGQLTNLTDLWLDANQLTGPIPSFLGQLTNLGVLGLSHNQLTGSIPSSLGSLADLWWLDLDGNQLTGPVPSFLGNLANLRWLELDSNQLTGPIPSFLGSLANLTRLHLDSNQLTGAIPFSLGNLTSLESLLLYENQLTGSIPAALCRFEDTINPQQGGVNLPCASSAATAQSLAALSMSDARAEEAVGAAVAFAVTLSGAASDPVTVDYATRDGSARAGEDYAAASGTLTFAAGESSKTVEVEVLDDAHDEGEETFVLALSNASGARLEDAEATGTIENTDLVPVALLARFGRATAQHVVEHVEERMAKPREPGFRARFAGREVGPGMERDFALDFLSQFGRPAGTNPMGRVPDGLAHVRRRHRFTGHVGSGLADGRRGVPAGSRGGGRR